MTPERWKQIEALYHAARALPAPDRSAYLAASCPNDQELQREVERLLSQPPSNEGFLAGQARDVATGLVTHYPGLVNRTLGGYEMQALIGVGGMGEVYRAKDLKLGREVAIKVLPHAFTSDPGRLARFDREARTLAALNHPNICAIHGFEHAGDIRFLVLELVKGPTLAELIALGHPEAESVSSGLRDSASAAGRGGGAPRRLKIDDALHIARQIARALHFAHERGIVHRDLKPANVKVTADGAVKVLDFGLAKATAGDAAGADLEPVPNVTHDGTIEGALLGTPAYMSPEQARGKPVDKRTDIWAFGCVLYEMLTGRTAFYGDTLADTIARVIEREPDWSALPRSTPEPIRQLLLACLAKDSQLRLQDIDDVTIDSILSGPASGTTMAATDRRISRRSWLTLAGLAAPVAGLAWSLWRFGPWRARGEPRRLVLPAGQVLDGSGGAHVLTISRDGARLAYVASPRLLYVWSIGSNGSEASPVPGTQQYRGVRDVEFSPDGKEIAFYSFADRTLKRMPVGGGPDFTICDAETPTGIHWGSGDVFLFGQGKKGIWQASVNGTNVRQIAGVEAGEEAHGPKLLPDGDHFLFSIAKGRGRDRWDRAEIFVQSLSDGTRVKLPIMGSDARYVSTRHLIYAVSGILRGIRFDPDTRTAQGTSVVVLDGDGVSRATGAYTGSANFSVSDAGTLVYVPGPIKGTPLLMHIALIDPTGKTKPVKLKAPADRYDGLRLSPDGITVAAGVEADKDTAAIYTLPVTGGRYRLTPFDSDSRHPAWTHDSSRIAFQSNRGGDLGIWWQVADGSAKADRLTRAEAGDEHIPESWFPDGETLLYSVTTKGVASLWTMAVRNGTKGPPRPFGRERSIDPMSAVFSKDGTLVAFTRTDPRDREVTVCVERFPTEFLARCLEPYLADSAKHPRWSKDDTRLYYDPRPPDFESVEVFREERIRFGPRVPVPYHPFRLSPPGSRTPYDITADGHFVGLIPEDQEEYIPNLQRTIVVVDNWFETLKQKFQ